MKSVMWSVPLLCVLAISTVIANVALASDCGNNCTTVALANGGEVEICRGLRSSTYSDGALTLSVSYIGSRNVECTPDLSQLPPVVLWVKAGNGQALLTNTSMNDDRVIAVKHELRPQYDGASQGKCRLVFSYVFSNSPWNTSMDGRTKALNAAIMSDRRTPVEFAVSVDGNWDSRFGQNYAVSVKQYGEY